MPVTLPLFLMKTSAAQCLEEAGTNQVLIFVHSRKETYKTAKFLQEEAMRNDDLAKFVPGSSASREVLQVLSFDKLLSVSFGSICAQLIW